MPLTILIAAAAPPGGLEADVLVDQLATGALWAAPAAVVLLAQPGSTDERLAHADLVLTAGASALTAEVSRRAAELGVPSSRSGEHSPERPGSATPSASPPSSRTPARGPSTSASCVRGCARRPRTSSA